MAIIDSQIHAYEANTPKRPWKTVPDSPLTRPATRCGGDGQARRRRRDLRLPLFDVRTTRVMPSKCRRRIPAASRS